jgi:maltose alpha-D-glucosyltransferase/alpha-amylase
MRRLLEVRSKHRAFGRGTLKLIYPSNRKILAYLREYEDREAGCESILCVANVSHASQAVEIDLSAFAGKVPVEMLGGVAFPPIGQLPYLLTVPPFGFYWFILATETSMPTWYAKPATPMPDYHTLVLPNGAPDLLRGAARMTLERDTLPQYLSLRRWYAGKQKKLESVRIALATSLPVPSGTLPLMMTEIITTTADGNDRYFIPLGVVTEDDTSSLPQQLALARVRRERRVGMLTDAFSLDAFAMLALQLIQEQATIDSADGQIRCSSTGMFDQITIPPQPEIRRMSAEQSNSSLVIGDAVVLKVIRHLTAGIHPELEMGRVLTARGYANTPFMLGDMTRIGADGTPYTMIVLQKFVHNQSDGWNWTLNTLARTAHQPQEVATEAPAAEMADPMIDLLQFAGNLGQRLAELHAVLAQPSDDSAFSPERAGAEDCRYWAQQTRAQLDAACSILQSNREWPDDAAPLISQLLSQQSALDDVIEKLAAGAGNALRTRIHGDFHLGQVLVGSGDVYIVDFEGEPARTLEQRREKNSPWRDVAGLLRSYDYAAYFSANGGPADIGEAALARRQKILQRYVPESRDTFLQAYRAAAPDNVAADALLDLFTLEKAAYEICYEAANRPAWLSVPLRGLAQLAGRLLNTEPKKADDA